MGHTIALLFHTQDADIHEILYPFNYDNEGEMEFQLDMTKENVQKEFNKLSPKEKKSYKNLDDFANVGLGYPQKNEDGDYGYIGNPNGCFDWFEIGGRYKSILIPKGAKESRFKKIHKEDIQPKKFAQDLPEYMRLKMMNPYDYCEAVRKVGMTSLPLKKIDWEATLKYVNSWRTKKASSPSEICETNYFCENEGYVQSGKEEFDDLIKYWGERKDAVVTIIDYHS